MKNSEAGATAARLPSGATLTIDLDAVAANYRRLAERAARAECAAVVKADAYGLGMAEVAASLSGAGCRSFFVALADEGAALRRVLPDSDIYVLNGALAGDEPVFVEHRLIPVLNDLGRIEDWARAGRAQAPIPGAVQIDTGMSRLGLPPDEVARLADEPARLDGIELRLMMSHLACSDQPDNPMNAAQRDEFRERSRHLPRAPASLANSSAIFLGPDFHFDMVRPGAALYGVNPCPGTENVMAPCVHLAAPIVQVRDIDSPRAVGYGASHRVTRPTRIATIAIGYADGYLRSLSNRGHCYIGDIKVPVVGRVSMDLLTLDVSAVAPDRARPGAIVDIISARHTVDDLAAEAGTIGYEILTSLGPRYRRRYSGGGG
ncbi:MAG: alanine racemase [Alphaproteobacteria bacterium]